MNVYSAIMKAADHIEAHPEQFDFVGLEVPDGCGSPGCAIGWANFFAGAAPGRHWGWDSGALSISDLTFYERMNDLAGSGQWIGDAQVCATTLRAYAHKYHAIPKRCAKSSPR